MLADGLGDLILILFCDFDEGVQFAEVDARLYGVFDRPYPALKFLLLGALEALEVLGDPSGHFGVGEREGLVRAEAVVGEIVREDEVKFCLGVIIPHIVK